MHASVVDEEARRRLSHVLDGHLQVRCSFCFLEQRVVEVRVTSLCLTARNQSKKQEIGEIQVELTREFADIREEQANLYEEGGRAREL
jgi:hypothetical protein